MLNINDCPLFANYKSWERPIHPSVTPTNQPRGTPLSIRLGGCGRGTFGAEDAQAQHAIASWGPSQAARCPAKWSHPRVGTWFTVLGAVATSQLLVKRKVPSLVCNHPSTSVQSKNQFDKKSFDWTCWRNVLVGGMLVDCFLQLIVSWTLYVIASRLRRTRAGNGILWSHRSPLERPFSRKRFFGLG